MSDRREPTISGLRVDVDEQRVKRPAGLSEASHRQPKPIAPSRPVVVKSRLAPIALMLALVAGGASAYVYSLYLQGQQKLIVAEDRITELEQKLVLTDDEANASLATLQVSLKEAHSEIRKLWGVSYDTNRKSITANKTSIERGAKLSKSISQKTQSLDEKLKALSSEMALVSDLVDAQQTAMTSIEKMSVSASSQVQSMSDGHATVTRKLRELEKKAAEAEKDIEAINGFRRTVNRQILELKGGATQP